MRANAAHTYSDSQRACATLCCASRVTSVTVVCALCAEHARVCAPVLCCAWCVHKVCVADRGRSPFCVLGH